MLYFLFNNKVVVNVAAPGNEECCQQQINRLYTDILDKSRCDMCMEMVLNLINQDNTKCMHIYNYCSKCIDYFNL